MLRRTFDRAIAVPNALLSKPETDEQHMDHASVPSNTFLRYASMALGLTAACLPLYVVRWKYGPISTTLLELLIVVTIALYLLGRREEGAFRFSRTPYDVPILFLLLAGASAVFVPPDRWHALGLFRAYFVEPIAIFYVAVDLLRRPGEVRGVLLGLGVGSSIFAVLNVGAFFVSFAQGTFVLGSPPTALYTSGPEVAMYLEPPLALAAGFALFADQRRDRLLAVAWLVFLTPALTLTFSRGAYLAIAVLALVAIASSRARIFLTAGLIVVVLVLFQVPLVQKRLAGQFDLGNSQTTIRGRFSIFSDTFNMLRDHPIFGNGLGGYHYLFRGTILEIYPHNMWLTFWVEIGLLGMVAFAVIFLGLMYRGWRAFPRAGGFNRAVLWGVSGSLVLWGVHGLFDSPYWKNDMSLEFWILAALELVAIRAVAQVASAPSVEAVSEHPKASSDLN
jgi:O-antigen ligase